MRYIIIPELPLVESFGGCEVTGQLNQHERELVKLNCLELSCRQMFSEISNFSPPIRSGDYLVESCLVYCRVIHIMSGLYSRVFAADL